MKNNNFNKSITHDYWRIVSIIDSCEKHVQCIGCVNLINNFVVKYLNKLNWFQKNFINKRSSLIDKMTTELNKYNIKKQKTL